MAAKKRAKRKSVKKNRYAEVKITIDQANHVIDDLKTISKDIQNIVTRIDDVQKLLCRVDFCSG